MIAFRNADLRDVHFVLVDPARARPLNVLIEHLNINPNDENILLLDLVGGINEFPLRLRGHVGPWQNLLDGRDLAVDLEKEALNLSLQIKQRKGLGITLVGVANSFMKLRGTLRTPVMRLDPTGSATTAGAAVATGGLSLLAKGLWDRASSQSGICEDTNP